MNYKIWTHEEEETLKNLVLTGKYSYRQIGKIMEGRSIASITGHARRVLNINNDKYKPHKYEHDGHFFTIPNITNSYVAGFLAADGSIRQNAQGYWRMRLEISDLDKEHLLWLRDTLKHTGPLHSWGTKKTLYWQMHVKESYAMDLATNFGVVPNKTHHLQPPNLETFNLRFAYLLGLLDGDGCVHINNLNSLGVSYVSSSLAAVEWYQTMMTSLNFVSLRPKQQISLPRKTSHANAYSLAYSGARAVCLIKLAQAFAAKHNLPILARKWNNPRLNQYIADFQARFPQFSYDPQVHLS